MTPNMCSMYIYTLMMREYEYGAVIKWLILCGIHSELLYTEYLPTLGPRDFGLDF